MNGSLVHFLCRWCFDQSNDRDNDATASRVERVEHLEQMGSIPIASAHLVTPLQSLGQRGDIYIMVKCLSVCLSRKMITSFKGLWFFEWKCLGENFFLWICFFEFFFWNLFFEFFFLKIFFWNFFLKIFFWNFFSNFFWNFFWFFFFYFFWFFFEICLNFFWNFFWIFLFLKFFFEIFFWNLFEIFFLKFFWVNIFFRK